MKLAIVEPSKTGAEHLSFNQAVIGALIRRPEVQAVLMCSHSHREALDLDAAPAGPDLPVESIVARRFARKAIVEAWALWKAVREARRRSCEAAVFLSVFPPLLNWLDWLCRRAGLRATLVLHGELEGLVDQSRQRLTSFGFWVQRYFAAGSRHGMRCVVLSRGIHERVVQLYPQASTWLYWANHPISRPVRPDVPRDIPLATIGVATARKHEQLFGLMQPDVPAQLTHLGMCERGLPERFSPMVQFLAPPGEHLSAERFRHHLQRTATAIFPYGEGSYRLTVSGAMLDALGAGCNVVSLPNPFASDLQNAGLPVTVVPDLPALVASAKTAAMPVAASAQAFDAWSAEQFAGTLLALAGGTQSKLVPARSLQCKRTS